MRRLLTASSVFCSLLAAAQTPAAFQYRWVKEFGGSGQDVVTAVAVDAAGSTYITGYTNSPDFPVKQPTQRKPGASGLLHAAAASGTWAFDYNIGVDAVTGLAQDPRDSLSIYAVTSGGPMHTADGGASWARVSIPGQVLTMAVDPASSAVLYAATRQQGVLKSADAGKTWSPSNVGIAPLADGLYYIQSFYIDPRNPSLVFLTTGNGLARSKDAGATWTVIQPQLYTPQIAFDPFTPGVIYAFDQGPGQIVKSTDEGTTFGPASVQPYIIGPVSRLLIDPMHPGTWYAATYLGLLKSTDNGITWTQKVGGRFLQVVADPARPLLYAIESNGPYRVLASTDGFETNTALGPPAASYTGPAVVAGDTLLAAVDGGTDVFVTKLDRDGAIVYSTYFGGSVYEWPYALAVDSAGNVYVTGNSTSLDLPVTAGAYQTAAPARGGSFLFKLAADGTLVWSTWLTDTRTTPQAIILDAQGDPVLTGISMGDLPTTSGVFQPQFLGGWIGGVGSLITIPPGPEAFLTKVRADGTGLIFSTYVGQQSASSSALAMDANGVAFLACNDILYRVNADASVLLAAGQVRGAQINSLMFDRAGNLYLAGMAGSSVRYYTTPDAFETRPLRVSTLPGDFNSDGTSHGFISKMRADFSAITASTLLGGERGDGVQGLAFDASGNVIAGGYTSSKLFPTRAPWQGAFADNTGFVSLLDARLSNLLASTYVGDTRQFSVTGLGVAQDGSVVFSGTAASSDTASHAVAASVTLGALPEVRIDAVSNAASLLGTPLAPSGTFTVQGSGFGDDATITLDGAPVPVLSHTGTRLTAAAPAGFADRIGQAVSVEVQSGGARSNAVLMPIAATAPGLFSVDGSGFGQGWILNQDSTRNSPSNPAAEGSVITLFATGVGTTSQVGASAVAAQTPAVFIDGFYANGVDARIGPVPGLPGDVYQLKIIVPHSNPNAKLPPLVSIRMDVGTGESQSGVALSVGP